MYTLIIAEKPSVAQAIAAVVGSKKREDGYLSGPQYLVSWCIGHLVELAPPHAYNEAYKTWRAEDLPIVPAEWKYEAHVSTEKQLNILKRLMNLPDVETIICATDAGREGELIFRLVYNNCHCHKPVKRLWISSMEESAIRDGMEHLRDDAEFDSLYEAALCRQKADWLVGMNASRLYSLLYGTTIQVGRVLTPTLALIARREEEIQTFQQEPFYTVKLRCGFDAYSERITDKDEAEALQKACHLNTAIVKSVEQKTRTEKPPKLYDLTSLQRDANRLFGYTAQQTLDCAQALYEKKLITLLYMSENNLDDSDVFDQAARISARCNELTDQIQAADHRMEEITSLRQHIFNYSKTRDIFRAYCQCKLKEKAKFAAAHQTELDRHQAAKAAFNALGEQKLPTVKELSAEFEKLKQQKGKLYAEYRVAKEERAKLLTVKANLELILDQNPHEIEQEAQQHSR